MSNREHASAALAVRQFFASATAGPFAKRAQSAHEKRGRVLKTSTLPALLPAK